MHFFQLFFFSSEFKEYKLKFRRIEQPREKEEEQRTKVWMEQQRNLSMNAKALTDRSTKLDFLIWKTLNLLIYSIHPKPLQGFVFHLMNFEVSCAHSQLTIQYSEYFFLFVFLFAVKLSMSVVRAILFLSFISRIPHRFPSFFYHFQFVFIYSCEIHNISWIANESSFRIVHLFDEYSFHFIYNKTQTIDFFNVEFFFFFPFTS